MEHKLKILSKYYEAILQGKKTFEVRKDDRPFQEGDTLLLEECVTPDGCGYTGREMKVEVTYILRDSEYVKDGYCIMGIKIISTNKSRYYDNTPSQRMHGDVLRICQLEEQLKDAKQLLKAAVKDFRKATKNCTKNFINCGSCPHTYTIHGCVWRYTGKALALVSKKDGDTE